MILLKRNHINEWMIKKFHRLITKIQCKYFVSKKGLSDFRKFYYIIKRRNKIRSGGNCLTVNSLSAVWPG
jgi:hypothetical protein